MYNCTDIKKYIFFLKTKHGLSVTLHPIAKETLILTSDLMTFNIHDNPYCVYVKTFSNAQKHCVERQHKVLEKCRNGSLCGCCFAGVWEFVYPISNGTENVGFISVSGYGTENASSYINATSQKYCIPKSKLSKLYGSLNKSIPSKEEIDTLLIPLCNMLELAYIKSKEVEASEEHPIDSVIRYIKKNYSRPITLSDVCAKLHYSRSYVSHMFKQHTGRSFRQYLTDIRLDVAKTLLRYSELSITEIAFSVGCEDSTYFASIFKKHYGMSPSAYRKGMK